jgi:uncharacterized protein (DUF433 family)
LAAVFVEVANQFPPKRFLTAESKRSKSHKLSELHPTNRSTIVSATMNESKRYVRADEQGVLRVGDTRVPLDSMVAAFENGASRETIQQQYPALSLELVYGSIAYYLADPESVQHYLHRQEAVWEEWRTRASSRSSPILERLRALQRAEPDRSLRSG